MTIKAIMIFENLICNGCGKHPQTDGEKTYCDCDSVNNLNLIPTKWVKEI